MPIQWNQITARWYREASDFTGYSRKVADIIFSKLKHTDTLCDIGCGISLVDLELANRVDSITCIDIDPFAIRETKRLAEKKGYNNIHAICADGKSVQESYDTVISLFHGNVEDFAEQYFQLAKYSLLIAVHDDPIELVRYGEQRARKFNSISETSDKLSSMSFHYSMERHCIEFGQPFRNEEEIYQYINTYSKNGRAQTVQEYIEERVVKIEHREFMYYLPQQRKFAIYTIEQ